MKYARFERERRFLLAELPADLGDEHVVIHDRYITGTNLRLRSVRTPDGTVVRSKLARKVSTASPRETVITNLYLDETEYQILAELPGRGIVKHRYPDRWEGRAYSIDCFQGPLEGLITAEIEAPTAAELDTIPVPSFATCEITERPEFTGGHLAEADPNDILALVRGLISG